MIYVQQANLPISYIQLYFPHQQADALKIDKGVGSINSHCHPVALRVLAQRQVLRGTKRATREQFINEVEQFGTEIQLTHRSYAHSVGIVALSRTISQLMPLLQEALTEPRLDVDEVEQSKRAYIAELEARYDEDHSLAWLWLSRRLFYGHQLWENYSVESKHIEELTPEMISEAWPNIFSASTVLPCITSDLSVSQINTSLNPLLKALPHSSLNLECITPLIKREQNRLSLVHKPNKKQALLFIAHPTLPPEHPQSLALQVALCALGGTFSSPLMYEVRTKRGLSYGAYAGIKGEGKARFVCLHTTPDAQQALDTLEVMLSVYNKAVLGELTDEQINFAKEYLINAHPFSIETPAMRAALTANSQLMGINANKVLNLPNWISPLTVDEIRQAAKDHLSLTGLDILVFGDQEKALLGIDKQIQNLIHIDQTQILSATAMPEDML